MHRAIGAALVAALSFSPPAAAQMPAPCAPYELIAQRLAQRHGEALLWRGDRPGVPRLEVWASADGRGWTLIAIDAGGMACVATVGTAWSPGAAAPGRDG